MQLIAYANAFRVETDSLHWSLLLLKVYVFLCFELSVSSIQNFSNLNSDSLKVHCLRLHSGFGQPTSVMSKDEHQREIFHAESIGGI